jgi:hypothetical protein
VNREVVGRWEEETSGVNIHGRPFLCGKEVGDTCVTGRGGGCRRCQGVLVELCETTCRGTEVCVVGLAIAGQAEVSEKEIHVFCCTTAAR